MTATPLGPARTAVLRANWVSLLALIVVAVVGLGVASPQFLTEYNLYVVLRNCAVAVIIGLAQMVTLAIGELNLSIGALGGLVAVVLGALLELFHLPLPLAVVLAIALGAAAGALNGVLIVASRINGFIVTLATASAFTGMSLGITGAIPFYNLPHALTAFGFARSGPFPLVLAVTLLLAFAVAVVYARTVVGRRLLAVGGNRNAAVFSGISVERALIVSHTLSGTLVAIATVLAVAQLGSAQPTIGDTWVLSSFAAPIIGGVALTGGEVSVAGTFLAAVVIALIDNGLILTKANPYWVQFLLGVLILGAVGLGRLRRGSE